MPTFADRRAWIFDLDGTLTIPVHDFAAAKATLGLPLDLDLLSGALALPEPQRQQALDWIAAWEWQLAEASVLQADAAWLIPLLHQRGCRLGVLTRNTRPVALHCLEKIGLSPYFSPDAVLGRESAPPKPAPHGILQLLSAWSLRPGDAVMVGDYLHDARAGRAAGLATILLLREGPEPWEHEADLLLTDLRALAPTLGTTSACARRWPGEN
jgi:HAD superfamily hydrolase (TIGR01509 family)